MATRTATWSEVLAAFEKLGEGYSKFVVRDLAASAKVGEAEAKKNATFRHGVRSDAMRGGTYGRVFNNARGTGFAIGSDVPYAGIQDQGGTIRPRRGRWLTIPLWELRTAAGVSRFASPRDDPAPLFPWRSPRTGFWYLATSQGGLLRVRWRLIEEVTITGTQWLSDGFDAAVEDFRARLVRRIRGILRTDEA